MLTYMDSTEIRIPLGSPTELVGAHAGVKTPYVHQIRRASENSRARSFDLAVIKLQDCNFPYYKLRTIKHDTVELCPERTTFNIRQWL